MSEAEQITVPRVSMPDDVLIEKRNKQNPFGLLEKLHPKNWKFRCKDKAVNTDDRSFVGDNVYYDESWRVVRRTDKFGKDVPFEPRTGKRYSTVYSGEMFKVTQKSKIGNFNASYDLVDELILFGVPASVNKGTLSVQVIQSDCSNIRAKHICSVRVKVKSKEYYTVASGRSEAIARILVNKNTARKILNSD